MYRRRYRRPRRYRRRIRKSGGVLSTASKALSIAMSVKKMLNVEHKFVDTYSNNAVTIAGAVTPISLIAQGDTENQRSGDKVKANHLSVKALFAPANGQTFPQTVRFLIFKDKVSNGVVPTAAQLLQDTSAGLPQAMSHYNPDNCPSRFQILFDRTIVNNTVANGNVDNILTFYEGALSHHLTFSGTTAVQAAADTGHLYFYVQADNITGAAGNVYVSTRFSYIDN